MALVRCLSNDLYIALCLERIVWHRDIMQISNTYRLQEIYVSLQWHHPIVMASQFPRNWKAAFQCNDVIIVYVYKVYERWCFMGKMCGKR